MKCIVESWRAFVTGCPFHEVVNQISNQENEEPASLL